MGVGQLVLLRHGQSTWNLENLFTGWIDVDLSPQGLLEAREAGRLLQDEGIAFDRVHLRSQARDPHALDHARRARSDVAARRAQLAAQRASLRRAAGARQGADRRAATARTRSRSGGEATTSRRRRSRPTIHSIRGSTAATPGLGRELPASGVAQGHARAGAAVLERATSRPSSPPGATCWSPRTATACGRW